jgi:hypothetical protein
VRVLLWHVHGSWTTAFVHGRHTYLIPTLPDRGPDGRGRAQTYSWPAAAVEIAPDEAAEAPVDVVVLQRPEELDGLAARWLGGRRPGRDLPAIYLEHSTPQGRIADMRHPAADRDGIPIVHVTHFNRLFWDTGASETCVIEHGIPDPGYRYTGTLPHAAVVVNEPVRRGRVAGTDLLPTLGTAMPLDLFGMGSEALGGHDVSHAALHDALGARRAYLHPFRWTSLGLSLLEAMLLGLPVACLATTEAAEVIPRCAGVVSNDLDVLVHGLRRFRDDADAARACGEAARAAALQRFALDRFLADWDALLARVVG